jgi:hypothetical protein
LDSTSGNFLVLFQKMFLLSRFIEQYFKATSNFEIRAHADDSENPSVI